VVRATVPVLAHRAAELRYRHEEHVAHPRAEIAPKRGERRTELGEAAGELPVHPALVDVMIPSADFDKSHFQTEVSLDEIRRLGE
jgi:hypothetical protein